jgi:hypothetical protein
MPPPSAWPCHWPTANRATVSTSPFLYVFVALNAIQAAMLPNGQNGWAPLSAFIYGTRFRACISARVACYFLLAPERG